MTKHADPRNILPASLAPRGLSREEAAAYIGVSASLFDRMVKEGKMPSPKRYGARVIWDRFQLDAAFAALPTDGPNAAEDDIWSRVQA